MEHSDLTPRAALFDVYGTLIEVGPPPSDAEAAWQRLLRERLPGAPCLSRLDFSIACGQAIARHHEASRALGITCPEVCWPAIVLEVLPQLTCLSSADQDAFIFDQIQTGHTTRMTADTGELLRWLKGRSILLGIASNAQAYTLHELQAALAGHGLDLDWFEPDLRFWSFEHGFSKPDPHVFQVLTARLATRGVVPAAALMIGDRVDNDIAPARRHGWQTWQVSREVTGEGVGGWKALQEWLGG